MFQTIRRKLTITVVWLVFSFYHDQQWGDAQTTDEPCGGELEVTDYKLLKNPGYPGEDTPQGKYPPGTDCEWFYDGDENTLVVFKFWDLIIEAGDGGSNITCDYDFVNVSITSLESRKYCGFTAPPDPIIGLGSLFVHFHSDASVNYRGFQATYSIRLNYNPCDPDPCEDGECGRTEDRLRSKCNCNPGSTGERCEIDIKECESDPCENGGTCDDTIAKNEYSCQCPPMWEGVNCEEEMESPCASSPCQNEGTCNLVGVFNFECECRLHYKGDLCEVEDLPPCLSMPCQNDGECMDLPNNAAANSSDDITSDYSGYHCLCTEEWRGTNCETESGCANPGISYLEDGQRFDEGTTLEFSCKEGFILNGVVNLTCFEDGTWSHVMPECISNRTTTDENTVSSWLGSMIGLGVALAINVVVFTLWMVYRGPWVKMNPEETVSHPNMRKNMQSMCSTVSDDVFEDDRRRHSYYSYIA